MRSNFSWLASSCHFSMCTPVYSNTLMTSLNSRKNIAEKRSTMHTSSHQTTAYRPGGRTAGEAGEHSTRHGPDAVGVLSTQGAVEIHISRVTEDDLPGMGDSMDKLPQVRPCFQRI